MAHPQQPTAAPRITPPMAGAVAGTEQADPIPHDPGSGARVADGSEAQHELPPLEVEHTPVSGSTR
ncbi:MAG: hypothetical protein H0U67_16475 [Gemmatimonadetes bacterium]|nr:hypothetical protein [Gemmatimonadota bacterium]